MSEHRDLIVKVVVPGRFNSAFDYLLPRSLASRAPPPGVRVRVPFGRSQRMAVVVSVASHSTIAVQALRPVLEVVDATALLDTGLIQLLEWTARYYHRWSGEVFQQVLPAWFYRQQELSPRLAEYWRPVAGINDSHTDSLLARAPRQKKVWRLVCQYPQGVSYTVLKKAGCERSVLNRLESRHLIEREAREVQGKLLHEYPCLLKGTLPSLGGEQRAAVEAITGHLHGYAATVLRGRSVDDRVAVYLHVVARVLERHCQALILLPEISLVADMQACFEQMFHVPVCALHSELSDSRRIGGWQEALRGEAGVVISTRSGVFAPMHKLGVVIVEQEHDCAYKRQEGVRYSGRDVALYRAQLVGVPVLLGSATPSLETLHNSQTGRYRLLCLASHGVDGGGPVLELVSTRQQSLEGGMALTCLTAIADVVARGQQALVLVNRRGYASAVFCEECGWFIECPQCDACMVLHRQPPRLYCHHCNYRQSIPGSCPHCHQDALCPTGQGTEQTQDVLGRYFPGIDIIRIDRDSMRTKSSRLEVASTLEQGRPAILIGTRMALTGHHFRNLALVVLVTNDASFFSADFRGAEKGGQLIMQAAGCCGSAASFEGRVMIQTASPDNSLLRALINEGYEAFSAKLLHRRRSLSLPPFSFMATITAESFSVSVVQQFLQKVIGFLRGCGHAGGGSSDLVVIGPMPESVEKKRNRVRYRLQLQCAQRGPLHRALAGFVGSALARSVSARTVRWEVEVDPQELG